MALVKYTRPDRDLFSTRFNDILDEFFNTTTNYQSESFMPSVDISETEESFKVSAELPGMNKDDININLEKGRLTISGERKLETEEEGKNYHRVESHYGSFSRSFFMPDSIDENNISAKYENGILNITIGKSKEKVRKQIEIK